MKKFVVAIVAMDYVLKKKKSVRAVTVVGGR